MYIAGEGLKRPQHRGTSYIITFLSYLHQILHVYPKWFISYQHQIENWIKFLHVHHVVFVMFYKILP
jgi:hypothetical protein